MVTRNVRTARYAFSVKAECNVETFGKYRLQWATLEGRKIEIENVMEDNDRKLIIETKKGGSLHREAHRENDWSVLGQFNVCPDKAGVQKEM